MWSSSESASSGETEMQDCGAEGSWSPPWWKQHRALLNV